VVRRHRNRRGKKEFARLAKGMLGWSDRAVTPVISPQDAKPKAAVSEKFQENLRPFSGFNQGLRGTLPLAGKTRWQRGLHHDCRIYCNYSGQIANLSCDPCGQFLSPNALTLRKSGFARPCPSSRKK
jgi:hypothetical protein